MQTQKTLYPEDVRILRRWLDSAKTAGTLRRVLCLWLRTRGYKAEQIAEMIGWSAGQVKKIQSEYIRKGEIVFQGPGKGGRRNQYMTPVQEKKFINSLRDSKTGMIYKKIGEIKKEYQLAVKLPENSIPDSTIYRLLKRHGYNPILLTNGSRAFGN